MYLFIVLIIYSISMSHASLLPNEESNIGSKHPYLMINTEFDPYPQKRQKISPLSLKEVEQYIDLFSQNDNKAQHITLEYFEHKVKTGLVPLLVSEIAFLKKLSLEQWQPFFESYNDIFAMLCVIKAAKDPTWAFPEKIGKHIKKQARKCNVNAQYSRGLMYDLNVGETRDEKKAFYWYILAAQQGHAGAMKNIGDIYWFYQKDYKRALYWYTLAAQQGYARAQNNLGMLYHYGIEVPQNYMESLYWYLCAAQQGLAEAQCNVGMIYINGLEIAQDYASAFYWYSCAAQQGLAEAQYSLGLMFHKGQEINQDYRQAIYWYTLAAEQNYVPAQYNLGFLLLDKYGFYCNYDQSMKWLLTAAQNGHSLSQATIKDFFTKNLSVLQTERSALLSTLIIENDPLYMMIKRNVQNLYEDHKLEAKFNNFEEGSLPFLRKNKFAIPLLYSHYQNLVHFEEKVLRIIDELMHVGYLVDGWTLKDLTYHLSSRGEEHYYEIYPFCYYEENLLKEISYLCLGQEAVQKGNKLMTILRKTDEDLQSALSSCNFLERVFKNGHKSLLGKAINFQQVARTEKKVSQQEFKILLSHLEEQNEDIFANHLEGEKVSFKGMKKYLQELELTRQLPERLNVLLRHGVSYRNDLFAKAYPFLN